MKRIILACISLSAFTSLMAQEVNIAGPSSYIKCSKFYVTKAVRDLPIAKLKAKSEIREAADSVRRLRNAAMAARFIPGPVVIDPVMQTKQGERAAASFTTIENFDGDVGSAIPPDPNGAVGPANFVESINSQYHIYDKFGTSVAGPIDLATLFPGSEDDGDPIVMYDKFADRWFISEFQVPYAGPPYYLLVAVSQTSDPAGAYNVWWFNVGSNFPDYPKYSIWTDGYYATAQFYPQQIIVLERNRMLKGSPSAGMIIASLPSSPPFGGNNSLGSAPKTLDCDGPLPPYGTPNYLTFFENTNSGGYSNSIVMFKLATDTSAKTITVTKSDSMATSPFNAYFNGASYADIAQPGAGNTLDALDGTFNYRVPYMIFPGYNSVVLCNTVNTGGLVAGIRWYELRQNNVTKVWSIYQQGTYAPLDGVSRWNGSICMDNNGDISLAYSVSSNSIYPGIRYTGRFSYDALGQMTIPEQTAINGIATLNGVFNRWGDYSQSTLDPTDGFTFWHVNEYGGSGGSENTRIFSFRISPLGIPGINNDVLSKIYQSGNQLNVNATGLPTTDKVLIDLFDIDGKQISSQSMMPASGTIETYINVSGLATGIYFVRIGNATFQDVKKVEVNK
ncbi:MAG TPA: T9SS type A sorting domain-containing protein [Bacteroidia bacterium]|jgi:hypothetical protein|nr:T9SS type A sorting domain-containing protein [Bacteroidia bacterium]